MKLIIASILLFGSHFFIGAPVELFNTNPQQSIENEDSKIDIDQLLQEWVLIEGWLNKDSIAFEKMDTSIHNERFYKVLSFKNDQNIEYRTHNPLNYRMCGVGMIGMNSFTWEIDDQDYLVLHAIGQKLGESRFEYKTRYFIEHISKKKLKLVVNRRITNAESNRF